MREQLGNYTNGSALAPVRINGISNALSVEGSWHNSYALRADNTVWAWGYNEDGELGIGTNAATNNPVPVAGLSNVVSISASPDADYCLALKNDGTVWAWGDNNSDGLCGQLGDGSCESTNLPTRVIGLSNIVSISAGGDFAMALQNDGTVWAWGGNSSGELGAYGGSSTNAPLQVISPYFYSGELPVLTIVGGNNQAGTSGALLAAPLLVHVTETNGTALTNVPITFGVMEGDAQLRAAATNISASSISVLTDTNGIATAWVSLGTNGTNTIIAFATGRTNSASVQFSEYLESIISFSIAVTNTYVNTNHPVVPLNISSGAPSFVAVLVDTNPVAVYTNGPINFTAATWQPYPTNGVFLNSGDGSYSVWIGLMGIATNDPPTWQVQRLVLDTTPPVLTLTNPASVVSQPMIQVQGFANEALASVSFDISNATGIQTNQTGYNTGQFADTNLLAITTNYFQCYDIPLTTNGANLITVHATDLAGNTSSTNISVTLDYSGATNPPALTVIWPPDGTEIAGSQFTFQGQVNDPTAAITALIVDGSGNTNTAAALVERSGLFSVPNLPLGAGDDTLTITATDAAGNTAMTNLTLSQSSVVVTMNPLASNMYFLSSVTATGTVSDPSDTVTVNGVTATVSTNGAWEATNVPVTPGPTEVFDVDASGDSDPAQEFAQATPVSVSLMSYSEDYAGYHALGIPGITGLIGWYPTQPFTNFVYGPAYGLGWRNLAWSYQTGGSDEGYTYFSGEYSEFYDIADPAYELWHTNLPPGDAFNPAWEYDPTEGINTRVMIQPSSQGAIGTIVTYLVQAQVYYANGGTQAPPTLTQIQGVPLIPTTNADGSLWGSMVLQAPAGAQPEVTPTPTAAAMTMAAGGYAFNAKAVVPQFIVDANTNTISAANSNNVAIVGQNITLQAYFPGLNLSNFQWTVDGTTETNFYVSPDSLWTNGYPVPLTNINSSNISFFWVDGTYAGETKNVTCAAVWGGRTNTSTVTFTVVRPTVSLTTSTGAVWIDSRRSPRLRFGSPNPIYGPDGLLISNVLVGMPTNTPLNYYNQGNTNYYTEWVQLFFSVSNVVTIATNGSNVTHLKQTVGTTLDYTYPYDFPLTNEFRLFIRDNPSIALGYTNEDYASMNGNAAMWLMFEPATGGNWVPLWKVAWNFMGAATNNGSGWLLTSSTNISIFSSVDSGTNYPVWTNNAGTNAFPYIPPLPLR